MSTTPEQQPVAVPATAKQTGEVLERWLWTEPAVWTERMLTALEEGVKGGVWPQALAKPLLCGARVVLLGGSPCKSLSIL
jgi:RNA-directed DNA polymerase